MTPLCADVLAYTPPEPFDAMVFCFFGSMEEIVAAARRQCRGTVLAIVRTTCATGFPGRPVSRDAIASMPPAVCWTPRASPIQAQRAALDFPQPFRTLEDARTFPDHLRRGAPAEDALRITYFHRRSGLPVAAARRPAALE